MVSPIQQIPSVSPIQQIPSVSPIVQIPNSLGRHVQHHRSPPIRLDVCPVRPLPPTTPRPQRQVEPSLLSLPTKPPLPHGTAPSSSSSQSHSQSRIITPCQTRNVHTQSPVVHTHTHTHTIPCSTHTHTHLS
eukprot:GHVR01009806.1.p1 GENE.GHVR01009806.1~~GHVR01009806.1.p1  ORF type:complete len:132 (-),score=58.69 GHVR01009806.1:252-647(-)